MATKTKTKKSSVTKKKSAAKKGARKAKVAPDLYTLRMPIELRDAINARAAELTASRGSRVTAATIVREILAKSLKVTLAG